MDSDESSLSKRLIHLEETISFMENHIQEQDKEILGFQNRLDKVIKELKQIRQQSQDNEPIPGPGEEKPPHY